MRRTLVIAVGALALALWPFASSAQTPEPLEVGAMAPDVTLPAATRHGILAEPVSLSDYEGETVVLSFFFRARTRG